MSGELLVIGNNLLSLFSGQSCKKEFFSFFGGGRGGKELIPNKYCLSIFPTLNKENGYDQYLPVYVYMLTWKQPFNGIDLCLTEVHHKEIRVPCWVPVLNELQSFINGICIFQLNHKRSNNTVIYIGFHTQKECGEGN